MESSQRSGVHLGLYKYGQGYWVRVMTAVLAGLLILSGAAWAYREAGAVEIPVANWSLTLKSVNGDLKTGDSITVLGEDKDGEVEVGASKVLKFSRTPEGAGTMLMDKVIVRPGQEKTQQKAIKAQAFSGVISSQIPNPIFQPLYLQSAIAGLIFLFGAIGVFYYVGRKPTTVDFLIATDGEMRKVNWSTKKEIYGSTMVVVTATFLIAGFLFIVDTGFANFFRMIGVLR